MDSKLYVMALVSVLAVFAFGIVVSETSDDDAAISTGSSSSPLSSISTDAVSFGDNATYYVTSGGSVNISYVNQPVSGFAASVVSVSPSDCGLTVSNGSLSGSISKNATVTLTGDVLKTSVVINCVTSSGSGSGSGTISYTSPSAVDALTGSTVSYKPTTNVSGASFSTTTVDNKANASWLSLSSGTLSGTAPSVTSSTIYYYSIKATTPGGQQAVQTVSFTVYPVAKISTSVNTAYSATQNTAISDINLSGNVAMTWGKTGNLPAGLTLSGSKISGTPTEFGTFSIILKGYTTAGPAQTATKKVTFTVAEQPMTITSTAPTDVYYSGKNYTYTPSVNISAGATWTLSTEYNWLVLSNGVLTGTIPSDIGVSSVQYTLTATSAGGQTKTQTNTINVEPTAQFTSVPTASCVVIPIYDYDDNGDWTQRLTSAIMNFIGSIKLPSLFMDVDGTSIPSGSSSESLPSLSTDAVSFGDNATYYVTSGGNVSVSAISQPVSGFEASVVSVTPSDCGLTVSNGSLSGSISKNATVTLTGDVTRTSVVINCVASSGTSTGSDSSGSSSGSSSGTSGSGSGGSSSGSSSGSDSGSSSGSSSGATDADDSKAPSVTETGTKTFKFVWTGENANRVFWDFGDGVTAEGNVVYHTYAKNGYYKYSVYGVNDVGSSPVISNYISVDVPDLKTVSIGVIIGVIFLIVIIILVVYYVYRRKVNRAYDSGVSNGFRTANRQANRSGRKNGNGSRKGGRKN